MSDSISKLKKIQAEAQAILDERRVAHEEHTLSLWQKFAHFWVMIGRNFIDNRLPVRASALAYTTLLALIPFLAVGASIATTFFKGERGQKQIEQWVSSGIDKVAPQLGLVAKAEQKTTQQGATSTNPSAQSTVTPGTEEEPDARKRVTKFITDSIHNVNSGALGGVGTVALMFIAISLLANIEKTLNDIWGVHRGRSWFRRIVQYWAAITLAPLLLLTALTLNVGSHLQFAHEILGNAFVQSLVAQVAPVILLTITFSLFYLLMPNTRVHWKAALIGGLVGGLLVHFNHLFSTVYFGQVVRNSRIYGSLAILPVFLVGLYFSWLILLFGAQVSYVFQNRRTCLEEKQAENINQLGREFIALRVMTCAALRFHGGQNPATVLQFGELLGVPSRLVQKIVDPLLQNHLLIEVAGTEIGYAPARPLGKISYLDILQAMRSKPGHELHTKEEGQRELVQAAVEKIREAERKVAGEITLDALVQPA